MAGLVLVLMEPLELMEVTQFSTQLQVLGVGVQGHTIIQQVLMEGLEVQVVVVGQANHQEYLLVAQEIPQTLHRIKVMLVALVV
jgi:hypothetical protein